MYSRLVDPFEYSVFSSKVRLSLHDNPILLAVLPYKKIVSIALATHSQGGRQLLDFAYLLNIIKYATNLIIAE